MSISNVERALSRPFGRWEFEAIVESRGVVGALEKRVVHGQKRVVPST